MFFHLKLIELNHFSGRIFGKKIYKKNSCRISHFIIFMQ